MAKRISKKLMAYLGVILIILSVLYGTVNYIANERLPAMLGDNVEIEHVDVQVFGLTASFQNPSIKLEGTKKSPDLFASAEAKGITIQGFSLMELLIGKTIGVKRFIIDSLVIRIDLPEGKVFTSERKAINLFVTDVFTRIKVDQFELKQSSLVVFPHEQNSKMIDISGFNLLAKKVTLDTASIEEFFPLSFEESNIALDSFSVTLGEDYRFLGANIQIADSSFGASKLQLVPRYTRAGFARKYPYEKAMVDLTADSVFIDGLFWDKPSQAPLLLHADKADLNGLNILVYKDKRAPDHQMDTRPLLTGLIRTLPLSLSIDTIQLKDGYIAYEQFPVKFPRVGKVYFDDVYMTGYNVTNDSASIVATSTTLLDIQSRFMGRGDLEVQIKFDMTSGSQAFSVKGNLGEMPITYVNQVLAPLTGIKAEGDVQDLTFQFSGDQYDSKGQMDFQYTDLKVEVMGEERDKSLIKSVFGNLMLSNNNQKTDAGYKVGEIYFVRYQNKGFFNLLWNSVRVGMMDVIVPFYQNEDKDRSPEDGPKYKIEKD